MGKQPFASRGIPADRFLELRPFYFLCYIALLGVVIVSALFAATLWIEAPSPIVPASAALLVATAFAFVSWLLHRRAARRQAATEALATAAERPRLTRRLAPIRARLRELAGDAEATILVVPGDTAVMWTARSRTRSLVQITSAFWKIYADAPELDASLAHEAGHIAARDVESFQRILAGMSAAIVLLLLVAATAAARLAVTGSLARLPTILLLIGVLAACTVTLWGTWSALLVARELQADAYAAVVTGSEEPCRCFLLNQLALRERSGARDTTRARLWTWLVQPDLRWRSTLPALRGGLGARVEVALGLGAAGVLLIWFWVFLFASRFGAGVALWPGHALVVAGVMSVAYRFLWGRNLLLEGGVAAFSTSLWTWARFSLPAAAMVWLNLQLISEVGHGSFGGRGEQLVVAMAFPLAALMVWSAAKLALAWETRRSPAGPRLLPALLAFASLGAFCACSTEAFFYGDPNEGRLYVVLDTLAGLVLACVIVGAAGHAARRRTP